MADITKPNLPDAGAVDYNSGDIDYLIATDAVYYVNANRPHRNLAHRDNTLESKLDTVIDWLNASRGSVADLDTRLDVSINEDGTLKSAPDVGELEDVAAGDFESRSKYLRAQCPSGFLPPHKQAAGAAGARGVGYVAEGSSGDVGTARDSVRASLFTIEHASLVAGDANTINLKHAPMKVNVNGYVIELESRPSKTNNNQIVLPAAPSASGSARQDLVLLEVWKEKIEPGVSDDVMFPFGNVFYDESGTFDNCALSNADNSGGNYPAYLATAAEHGYYVTANDVNIQDFIKDERNNIGMTSDGKFFQVRWRIVTLSDVDPSTQPTIDSALLDSSGNYFAPQGEKATRPAAGIVTNANGIFQPQVGTDTALSTILDSGLYLGGVYTSSSAGMTAVTGLSLDGFVYAIPICAVHRRNSAAWNKAGNINGAGAIGGASGRPDDLYYDEVNERDIVDLRHRVCMHEWDFEALHRETLQQLLKSDLATNWEMLKEDPDGNDTYADLDIYGTKLLIAEGIKALAFDSLWDVKLRSTCNNGIDAAPDGIRNYYSDQEGTQAVFGHIANVGLDGVTPTAPFTYVTASKTLTCDATDLDANDGLHASRPQWSNKRPQLDWMDQNYGWLTNAENNFDQRYRSKATPAKVWGAWSGLGIGSDSISFVIAQESYVRFTTTVGVSVGDGDVYAAPNAVQITINGRLTGNILNYSGYFTGSTLPNSGVYTKISGSGPASFTTTAAPFVGYRYNTFGAYDGFSNDTQAEYVGEGYDLHSGKGISISAYLDWEIGSGFLSRVPYDSGTNYRSLDSIKRTEFRINGTQVLPDNGDNFHPFGFPAEAEHGVGFANSTDKYAGVSDGPTKSTGTAGFIRKGPVVSPGDEGTYDTTSGIQPCVIKDGTTYKMWYTGSDGTNNRIIYADSSDGITWANHQMVVNIGAEGTYDTTHAYAPCVIKDGATYKMWYTGSDGTNDRIIYCTSADGITWASHAMVLNIGSEGTYDTTGASYCWVVKDGATYRMLYSGAVAVWSLIYADSADGTTWANHEKVIGRTQYGLDANNTHSARFIKDNAVYKVWFYSDDGSRVSTMYAVSTDCKNWSTPQPIFSGGAASAAGSTEGFYDTSQPVTSVCIIKDDKAYKFWGNASNGTDYILHGVFAMQDSANTGSNTLGVYSSTGTYNFAPSALDDVLVFYEARANQNDTSRYGGTLTSGTGTLTYLLKYLPEMMIVSSLATGGKPQADTYALADYRDAISSIWQRNMYTSISNAFTMPPIGDPIYQRSIDNNQTFRDDVPYGFDATTSSTPGTNPKAGDYVSLSSLDDYTPYSGSGSVVGANNASNGTFGSAILPAFPEAYEKVGSILAGVGEKNKELFMPAAIGQSDGPGDLPRSTFTGIYNLIGRPLVR